MRNRPKQLAAGVRYVLRHGVALDLAVNGQAGNIEELGNSDRVQRPTARSHQVRVQVRYFGLHMRWLDR